MPRGEDCGSTCEANSTAGSEPVACRTRRRRSHAAQAVVEFAIGSIVFFSLIFGTIDFGRVIFMYAEMSNAVRDGARYATINPANTSGIAGVVISNAPSLGLTAGDITNTCDPSCTPGGTVTVEASLQFQAITQKLLHIGALTLTASASDGIE